MTSPLDTSRPLSSLKPLSLDDLDQIAGGLDDNDQNRIAVDASLANQAADGAAAAQAQQPESSPTPVDLLVQDFQRDGQIDATSPQQIANLAGDLAGGKLDGQIGTLIDVVSNLDSNTNAEPKGQLSAALLDRFADFTEADRPDALADLLDEPAFQPDRLAALADGLMDTNARGGLELLHVSAEAFADAGRAGDAASLTNEFTGQLASVLSQADGNQTALLLADGTVTLAQCHDAFLVLGRDGSSEGMVEAYGQLLTWNDEHGQPAAGPLPGDMRAAVVERLSSDAASVADNDAPRAAQVANLCAEIAALDPQAAWQMVGAILDLPVSGDVGGDLSKAFEFALQAGVNTAVIGRLLADGVVTPPGMMGSLLQHYDVANANPAAFEVQLKAIAAAAGTVGAAFGMLIPGAVFSAIVNEAADGRLGASEIDRAVQLLLANRSLPVGNLHEAVLIPIFDSIGKGLATQFEHTRLPQSGNQIALNNAFIAAVAPLRELVDAGPAAIAAALVPILLSKNGSGRDWMGAINSIGDPAMRLEVMIAIDNDPRISVRKFDTYFDSTMAKALLTGSVAADLATAVLAGRMDSVEAGKVIAELSSRGGNEVPGLAALRQAELAAELIEAGSPESPTLLRDLRAGLAAVPSPLIKAAIEAHGALGLSQALQALATAADAADVPIGEVLARVHSQTGADVNDAVPSALAGLVAKGELTADQARDAARSAYAEIALIDQGAYGPWFAPIAAELGYARLVDKASTLAGTNPQNAAEMRELRQEFHDLVASGQFAASVIRDASTRPILIGAVIDLLYTAAAAADVFVGSLVVDVLGNLGNPIWGNTGSIEFRDALRENLRGVLLDTGDLQKGWVAAIKEAVVEGRQSAAAIAAELESIVEHAFARESVKNDPNHVKDTAAARQAMSSLWSGVDRLIAATGAELLADAGKSAAARDNALNWFRAQEPSGQLAILKEPAAVALLPTLREIAALSLDRLDWTAEKLAVSTTISVGTFTTGHSAWAYFKSEQAMHDLRGAIALAGVVGESQLAPVLDMVRAWGSTALSSTQLSVPVGLLAHGLVAGTGRPALIESLIAEVKTGETTIAKVVGDIRELAIFASNNIDSSLWAINRSINSPTDWANLVANDVNASLTTALLNHKMAGAAEAAFMAGIDNGTALKGLTPDKLTDTVNLAIKAGASVDYVLAKVIGTAGISPAMEIDALNRLQARIASGATVAGIAAEVADGGFTASRAMDILKEVASDGRASFGDLLADMLDSVQTKDARVYGLLSGVTTAIGANELARSIGADVAAGRLAAPDGAAAVLEISQATKGDAAHALAGFVASAASGAAGAEAVKLLDDIKKAGTPNASISDALDSILTTLSSGNHALVKADAEALSTLADLFIAGAVDRADIGGLISAFDGKVPDGALVSLVDKINALPQSAAQDELKLVVCRQIADRIHSGALFNDLIPGLEATYRAQQSSAAKNLAYAQTLTMAEKAMAAEGYAGYLAGIAQPTAANHAAAETLLAGAGGALQSMQAAYRLFEAAYDAPKSGGSGFTNWLANTAGEDVRTRAMGGLMADWTADMERNANMPAAATAHFAALQQELMQPRLMAALSSHGFGNSPTAAQMQVAAGQVAAEIGSIAEKVGGLVTAMTGSSAAIALLSANRDRTHVGEVIADSSARWVVMAGSAAYSAATGGLPMTIAVTAVAQLMQVEGFRSFCGTGLTATIEAGLKVIEMGRSVLISGAEAFIEHKVDSAVGVWTGTTDFFSSLSHGDAASAGNALLKFVDNLSALCNVYDMRSNFLAIQAGLEQAVAVFKQGYAELSRLLSPMLEQDRAYERKHTLGISFL